MTRSMNWHAVFVILAMAVAAGSVIYLPFFIWFRWKARRSIGTTARSVSITKTGALFYFGMVLVLFGGFANGVFQPNSWFGSQVRTVFGGIGYAAVVCAIAGLFERGLLKLGVVLVRRDGGSGGGCTSVSQEQSQ